MTPGRIGAEIDAFRVKDCAMITMALGRSAGDLVELRRGVAEAPVGSIHHHFFHTLLRPTFDDPEFRNDFALWARRQLHDYVLAERLDIIDPVDYRAPGDLREQVLAVIDQRLAELERPPTAAPGREFHFNRSQIVVFDTKLHAGTPSALAALIPGLSSGSIYYHFVEARRRGADQLDDFSRWLELWGAETQAVRQRLAAIDIYLWALSALKEKIAGCFVDLKQEARST